MDEIMQELITRYIDGDVTPDEKLKVEEALRQSEPLKKFYTEMVNLNSALDKVPFEETSPDWERKVEASLRGKSPLGGSLMNKMTLAFQAMPKKQFAVVVCLVVLVSLVSMQTYIRGGIQGRLKQAADDIGEQFSFGLEHRTREVAQLLAKNTADLGTTVQYEPYYLDPSYEVQRETAVTKTSNLGVDIIPSERMLIRKADYGLLVEDCEKTYQRISDLVRGLDGVVIESNIEDTSYSKNGVAIFKVLPTKFDAALQTLSALGTVESKNVTGDDVTEEYVDLGARLKNQKNVRDRLQAILDQKTAKMDEILKVEKEIARVSENIERIEGKMKFYDREVSMSTITIRYHEKQKQAAWTLDYFNDLKYALQDAAEVFVRVLNGGIVIAAMVIPFALWIFIAALVVLGLQKLFFRKKVQ